MKRAQIYQSEDGLIFNTAEKCQAYEHKMFIDRLCGLTEQDVSTALASHGVNLLLAAALERAGQIVAAKRRAGGDLRRRKRPATDGEKLAAVGDALRKASK